MGSKLSNPLVHVWLADGSDYDVQTLNWDMIRYEETGRRHKWPASGDSPMLWITFLAWSASERNGLIPAGTTWEAFRTELCLSVGSDGTAAVDPTQPAPDTD